MHFTDFYGSIFIMYYGSKNSQCIHLLFVERFITNLLVLSNHDLAQKVFAFSINFEVFFCIILMSMVL